MTRVPHLQGRYIKRANWLIREPQFRLSLKTTWNQWEADYPDFPYVPGARLTDSDDPLDFAYPVRLSTRLKQMSDGVLTEDLALSTYFAKQEWESHCYRRSKHLFDPEAFPEFDIRMNPGSIFLSHCLVFDILDIVPERYFAQLIRPEVLKELITWDVKNMAAMAENAFLRAQIQRLVGDDSDAAEEIFNQAEAEFWTAANKASLQRDAATLGDIGTRLVIPIPAAATKAEVREASSQAWERAQQSNSWSLESVIRKLYRASTGEGVNEFREALGLKPYKTTNDVLRSIGNYVGVDAAYVRRIVKPMDDRSANSKGTNR